MELALKPVNKLTYKFRLTPQMRLSINLLQMPLIKLKEFVEKQVEENPLLNMESVKPPKEASYDFAGVEDQNYKESLITKPATLQDHLLSQLQLLADSDDAREIGELIIGNINDDGYLGCPIEDIKPKSGKITRFEVGKVLSLIQTFDPIGVGARDLRECLLLQIKAKGEENSLAGQIIDKYLAYLEKKRFEPMVKKLSAKGRCAFGGKITVERIKEAIKEIAKLEPKPGRLINTERAVRLIPDAILKRNEDKLEVILNDWEMPSLSLNPKYKAILKQKDTAEDTKEYLRERLKAGRTLIDALHKRKQTLQEVTEAIVSVQRDFWENGNFQPMTSSQIAKLVGKHKSTVSRAMANKYLQTPDGIFELRQFLNSGVKQGSGELFSSKAIKSKIKEFIKNENKENPLTDRQIIDILKQEGISVSRRTIAKYRSHLKILSYQSRRE
ncbi:MAG: RNA polymerase factor sigma-54 [Candidatus Omnitrophica bacterium]|nr:RNA polymerase factor sigma-54 [Candidatus Omnitrophota bacterium]MBU4487701.1 RNA polymerase factor sigma-54 [Candidatus Omnitrophota bacterium]